MFFGAFNAFLSKVGRSASEETILALIRAKCLPILLYATEVCPMLARDRSSLKFTSTRILIPQDQLQLLLNASVISIFSKSICRLLFALPNSSTFLLLCKINYVYYIKMLHHVNWNLLLAVLMLTRMVKGHVKFVIISCSHLLLANKSYFTLLLLFIYSCAVYCLLLLLLLALGTWFPKAKKLSKKL